jgi:hypothetical protein
MEPDVVSAAAITGSARVKTAAARISHLGGSDLPEGVKELDLLLYKS